MWNWTADRPTDKSCKGKLNINRLKIYEVTEDFIAQQIDKNFINENKI